MTKRESLLRAQSLAKSGVLYAPVSFMLASIAQLEEICNGCGAADSWFRPPASIWGTCIIYACHIHDWMYNEGVDDEDKQVADRSMKHNMQRLIRRDAHKWYKPTKLQYARSILYYEAVVNYGGPAFWAGKN